jgi:hypothetical protein
VLQDFSGCLLLLPQVVADAVMEEPAAAITGSTSSGQLEPQPGHSSHQKRHAQDQKLPLSRMGGPLPVSPAATLAAAQKPADTAGPHGSSDTSPKKLAKPAEVCSVAGSLEAASGGPITAACASAPAASAATALVAVSTAHAWHGLESGRGGLQNGHDAHHHNRDT